MSLPVHFVPLNPANADLPPTPSTISRAEIVAMANEVTRVLYQNVSFRIINAQLEADIVLLNAQVDILNTNNTSLQDTVFHTKCVAAISTAALVGSWAIPIGRFAVRLVKA